MKKKTLALTIPILVFFLLFPSLSQGQAQGEKRLTYEQVYGRAEPQLTAALPRISGWADDSHYLVMERDEKTGSQQIFKVNVKSGEKSLFFDWAPIQNMLPKGFNAAANIGVSGEFEGVLFQRQGDLYHLSVKDKKFKRLTATLSEEMNSQLSPDGKFVAYTRDHNLYSFDIENGLEYQLTSDGSDVIYNGWASWVYMEEILGRGSRYRAFWWSPDSQKIAFLRFDDSPVPIFPIFRSTGQHGDLERERYPKPGDPNPYVKLGIAQSTGENIVWADVEEKADHYVAFPIWLPDSSKLTFQWMNREQDNIKLYSVDLKTGKKAEFYDEQQDSWVDFFNSLHFFEDGSGFLLQSDVDGWSHLYTYDLNGNLKKRLTQGEWSVGRVSLVDEKNRRVFFSGSTGDPTESHFFVVNLDGTGFKQLTKGAGSHRVNISPGGNHYIDSFSDVTTPTKQDLYTLDGKLIRNLGDSRTPLMDEYNLARKEMFIIPTEDGWNLPACWVLPSAFDESKKYPVIFSIYSGPGSASVSNSYPSLSQQYFAQEGIITISVDHRGSGHFGKKGMALMHRSLGKWEMHDLIEAVKWLHTKSFIDKEKIGITGGSYGGYATCMALTYGADYFTHGYARSSVTDWHLYDSVYTERYMDRPFENKEGYAFGSAMTHAKNLKGVLFMAHGDMDDNVHMQNTIQLIDKLMDEGKMFEYMVYPNQRHGFGGQKRTHSNRHYVDFWFKHFLDR
jgi:dipeptidyl-peptidase-4